MLLLLKDFDFVLVMFDIFIFKDKVFSKELKRDIFFGCLIGLSKLMKFVVFEKIDLVEKIYKVYFNMIVNFWFF